MAYPTILKLKFPFDLKDDQLAAVQSWIGNGQKGSIIYSTGTGKTEIAFECAKMAAFTKFNLLSNSIWNDVNNFNPFIYNNHISQTTIFSKNGYSKFFKNKESFNILFVVPRIILIEQNLTKLYNYGIPKEKLGVYFGEKKDIKEITISTYQSIIRKPELFRDSDMIILDEIHLISKQLLYSDFFKEIVHEPEKSILGLTATIDTQDPKSWSIISLLPPVKRYQITEAIKDGRLAKPIVIPVPVRLTQEEQKSYDKYSEKIRNISTKFKRYDSKAMSLLLLKRGFAGKMAKYWFANVRNRKVLLSCSHDKLDAAIEIIKKHRKEKIMVFSETLESLRLLCRKLASHNIESEIIDSAMDFITRKNILKRWGGDFFVLSSIHTLEIGYDVPDVSIEIILATTSNINQIVQRIGRVIRKYNGKSEAFIYVIYVTETKDNAILNVVRKATEMGRLDHDKIGESNKLTPPSSPLLIRKGFIK